MRGNPMQLMATAVTLCLRALMFRLVLPLYTIVNPAALA